MTPVDLVIFDYDGTMLVDSETVATEVMVAYLAGLDAQLWFDETLIRFKDGRMADCVVALEAIRAAPPPGDFAQVLRERITP
jgi:beta-phosphoglucomutase-like phosphatase (HAD superfamily)